MDDSKPETAETRHRALSSLEREVWAVLVSGFVRLALANGGFFPKVPYPARKDEKAIVRPSGETTGLESLAEDSVSLRG